MSCLVISHIPTAATVLLVGCLAGFYGQQAQPATAVTTVPRLVRISSSFHPANGLPAAPVQGVTLSIYGQEHEGTPLWQEIRIYNDPMMGSTSGSLPMVAGRSWS